MLQYLFEARNDDEHGLEPITEHKRGALAIGVNKPGFSREMKLEMRIGFADGNNYINATPLDGKPILFEHTPDTFALSAIRPRGRQSMQPPTTHLGKQLADPSPVGVASVALAYMEELLQEASALA